VGGKIKLSERAQFLTPLIRHSFADAEERGESLTLLRPKKLEITWAEKSASEIEDERAKHADLADQMSMFDEAALPLEPCPVQFIARWQDQLGNSRRHECDDWETSTAFNRFDREYGRKEALSIIREKYAEHYLKAGLALAFSTHSRRNVTHGSENQWLLVGLVRIDLDEQADLFMT
jgi:hypothetical protein